MAPGRFSTNTHRLPLIIKPAKPACDAVETVASGCSTQAGRTQRPVADRPRFYGEIRPRGGSRSACRVTVPRLVVLDSRASIQGVLNRISNGIVEKWRAGSADRFVSGCRS